MILKQRRRNRKDRSSLRLLDPGRFLPPPPPSITVVSVTATGQYLAVWEFSAPVTLGAANVPELEIDAGGQGLTEADSVVQVGPTVLRADYSTTTGVFAGDAWQITAQPGAIAEQLAVPLSGSVS